MTKGRKGSDDRLPEEWELGDLPPLAGEEEDGAGPGEDLAAFVDEYDDPRGEEVKGSDLQGDAMAAGTDLIDVVDEGWLDDDDGDPSPQVSVQLDDEADSWLVGDEEEPGPGLEDDWFDQEEEEPWPDDDRGAQGPVGDDDHELDESEWASLEGWDDDGDDEDDSVSDLMEHLGIELSGSEADHRERPVSMLPPAEFLGPVKGEVRALDLSQSRVAAAGDGVFTTGADGMLHPRDIIADIEATSLVVYEGVTFLGTERHGAVAFLEEGGPVRALNGWNAMEEDSGDVVSTDFHLTGIPRERGYRLIGLTGCGHLYCSDDFGTNWLGPLTEGTCLAVAVDEGSQTVFVLEERGAAAHLSMSADLAAWREIPLPVEVAHAVKEGPVSIAAAGDTVAVAVFAPSVPLFVSFDLGRTFHESELVTAPAAVRVDPSDPGTIAAAVHDRELGEGTVLISGDGAKTWAPIFVTQEEGSPRDAQEGRMRRGLVTWLGMRGGVTPELFAVTSGGVYRIQLPGRPISH